MSKIRFGLIFGSFNPIHRGHMQLAKTCLDKGYVDEIAFVVAKQNPFKDKYSTDFWQRYNMVELYRKSLDSKYSDNIVTLHVEYHMKDTRTYNVLEMIKNFSYNKEYIIICGDDMYNQIHTWYNGQEILDNYNFIVFSRDTEKIYNNKNVIAWLRLPEILDISSSNIRERIKNHENVLDDIPIDILHYINDNQLYLEDTP